MTDDVAQQIIDLNYQVIRLYNERRYKEATTTSLQACDLARQHFGANHEELANSLSNLAFLYEAQGEYLEAERVYREALTIYRAMPEESALNFAGALNNLAFLYSSMGNYAAAEPLYREALQISRANSDSGDRNLLVAQALNNLGVLYLALDNNKTAEAYLQQALEIRRDLVGDNHPVVAGSLNNLAELYREAGNLAQAKAHLQEALKIQRAALEEQDLDIANTLNSLAVVYRAEGDYDAAFSFYQEALDIWRNALGERHPIVATCLNNLALLYKTVGNFVRAAELLQQSLKLRRDILGKDHPDVAGTLYNLASVSVAMGDTSEALPFMQEAAVLDERLIGQVFSIGSESQRMAYLVGVQSHVAGFLSLVLRHLSHSSAALQAGFELVLRRKAVGAEALAAQRDAILSGRYPALESTLHKLQTLRMQIAQATLVGPGSEGLRAYQQRLAEQNTEKEQLEAELAHHIPEMNLAQKLRAVDRQQVAQALPAGSALVEFVRFDVFNFRAVPARGEQRWEPPRYIAFVLASGKPDEVYLTNLGEAERIDQMIATFRSSITGEGRDLISEPEPSEGETGTSGAAALRAAVFDPLLPALGSNKRLFLAPDGDLTRLPFEALPIDNEQYLIDAYHISYLGVGRDLLRFEMPPAKQPAPPLVIADPDFDLKSDESITPPFEGDQRLQGRQSRDLERGSLRFERLLGTRDEGEQVAAKLHAYYLQGKMALEGNLKEDYHSPRILHIATHGFFLPDQESDAGKGMLEDESTILRDKTHGSRLERFLKRHVENPLLRSGLALAGVNTWSQGGSVPPQAEDGILTAEDVSGLDLSDTELVVLSACETGMGEVHAGEGVFGLQRAFVLAGARTLVMSLWKVPDWRTQELMQEFYGYFSNGYPCSDALRKAQLMIKARYVHPFNWGAFICQGDPNLVARSRTAT